MKTKYIKILLLGLSLVTMLSSNCFAGENLNSYNSTILNNNDDVVAYAKPATEFTWRIKSIKKDDHTSTKNNNWVLQYEGEPARINGEYVTPKQKSNIYSKIVNEDNIENYKVKRVEIYEPNEEGIYELSEIDIQ